MNIGRLDFLDKLLHEKNREILNNLTNNRRLEVPKIVELDLTTACNYNCYFCVDEKIVNKNNTFDRGRILTLIEDMGECGVQAVILIGGGEPMAYPYFNDVLEALNKQNIVIGLTTNGSYLGEHLDSIKKYVSWVRVSMDAATQEMHNFLKSPSERDDFNKVVNSMKMLAEDYSGSLGYSYIVNEHNYKEMIQAAVLAKEIGCAYIQFKAILDKDSKKLKDYNDKYIEYIRNAIGKIRKIQTENFSTIIASNLNMILSDTEFRDYKNYDYCWAQEFRTLITPKGFYICPYHRGNDIKKFGSIQNQTLREIWNSDDRKNVVKQHSCKEDCNFHCIRNNVNEFLSSITDLMDKGINILPYLEQDSDSDKENCLFI